MAISFPRVEQVASCDLLYPGLMVLPPLRGSLRNAGFLPATFIFELPTIRDIQAALVCIQKAIGNILKGSSVARRQALSITEESLRELEHATFFVPIILP